MTSFLCNASVDLMIFEWMDKEDPNLYYGSKNTTLWVLMSKLQSDYP